MRWSVKTRALYGGVNTALNDDVIIAAVGDGTLRWYRAEDGSEILAPL